MKKDILTIVVMPIALIGALMWYNKTALVLVSLLGIFAMLM